MKQMKDVIEVGRLCTSVRANTPYLYSTLCSQHFLSGYFTMPIGYIEIIINYGALEYAINNITLYSHRSDWATALSYIHKMYVFLNVLCDLEWLNPDIAIGSFHLVIERLFLETFSYKGLWTFLFVRVCFNKIYRFLGASKYHAVGFLDGNL